MDIAAIAAHIPIDRQLALAGLLDLPERTQGAALFADISGFTPLTEALAAELGPRRGAEELTHQLDAVFGAITAEVHRCRGSVIAFAGDAITCWFAGDPGPRAVACGLAMQQAMRAFATVQTPGGRIVALALKVAVAAGPARRLRVGDPAVQCVDVLAGSVLDRMAAAEHRARQGEVVVAPEVATALGPDLVVREWRAGGEHGAGAAGAVAVVDTLRGTVAPAPWPAVPPGALRPEQVQPWLHRPVYERLRAGQDDFLAELRPAVALFLRFGGLDFDGDDAVGQKLDAFVRWVEGYLARQEATLVQVSIGDKGSFLYIAFGAPQAHDDDAARAVATALELRAPPPALAYITGVQIGISRGRARVGAYGGPAARTYGVLGDATNLAARLMTAAAPGEILVSRRIADLVGDQYALESGGEMRVKGKSAPVPVLRVQGRRSGIVESRGAAEAGRLVGRDHELARLAATLAAARGGQGQILRLEAPAGVGKSRLAAELARQAAAADVRVLRGACLSSDRSAFAPWRPIFRTLFGLAGAAGPATAPDPGWSEVATLEHFVVAIDPTWRLRLPLLGDLLGLAIPDNATTAGFEPRLRQAALFDLLADAVQKLATDQPLLITVDDVHWMDAASQELTLRLGRAITGAPVMLLLLSRPPLREEPILPGLEALPIHSRLALDELAPEALGALVRDRLGGEVDPLALGLLGMVTQGNAFFAEEVVRTLRESSSLVPDAAGRWALAEHLTTALRHAGQLVWADGRWALTPDAALGLTDAGLPDSVESAVLTRLDRLPDAPKLTLKVASVVGLTFPLDLLALTHPLQPADPALHADVALLDARGFTIPEQPPPRPVHAFRHNITHDVVYGTLLHEQARRLHATVGEALERLAPEAATLLAHHCFLGEDWPRALRYEVQAAEQARRLFANYDGIEHLRKALLAAEHLPLDDSIARLPAIHTDLGIMLTYTGQYDAALEHLTRAFELAPDREARARACRWIGYLYEYRGELTAARPWIERGLAALGREESAATAELLAVAGLLYLRQGDFGPALEACARSISIAAALGDQTALAFACSLRGLIAYTRTDYPEAIAYSGRAVDLYHAVDNIHGAALATNQIANAYFATSRWTEADRYYREAREVFSRTGDVLHQVFAGNNVGSIARDQGRLDDALHDYEAALEGIAQIGGSRFVCGCIQANLGATQVRRGDAAAAGHHLDESLALLAEAGVREFLPEVERYVAATALLRGDVAAADAAATRSLALARELAMRGDEGCALRVAGEVATARGDLPAAEAALRQSLAILTEVGIPYEAARAGLARARVLLQAGQAGAAAEQLNACVAVFGQLEARIELAAAEALRSTLPAPLMPGPVQSV